MKHLARITLFFGLIMAFALAASANAQEATSPEVAEGVKTSGKQITKEKEQKPKNDMIRSSNFSYSPLWIANTWLDYVTDEDGDGFYHLFRFSFDADTDYLAQALIAEVYLSDGSDEWRIFTSDVFWINGYSGADVYEISTALNTGYPTGAYDLVLRLYDPGSDEMLLEWTAQNDNNLDSLYLEDMERDTTFSSTPYVYNFELTLQDDYDDDGYYSNINMNVDIDAPNTAAEVRIGVELYNEFDGWISLYLSEAFTVIGTSNGDNQNININLDSGFPADRYQLRITVYESSSNNLLATQTIDELTSLESLDNEDRSLDDDDYRSSSSEGSGGSMGFIALSLLGTLLIARKRLTL